MEILKHFEDQFDQKPLSEKILSKLNGKSLYSEYQAGDIVYYFLIQECDLITMEVHMKLETIVERDMMLFDYNYNFLMMHNAIPVFTKKEIK